MFVCVGTEDAGSGKVTNEKKPLFSVRPKNIAFNVKPKKDHVPEPETNTKVTSSDAIPISSSAVTGLASLCATYDDDSSD